jgi:hypothetical protein
MKRLREEDSSKFCNPRVRDKAQILQNQDSDGSQQKYLILRLLGKGGYSEVY